MWSPREDRALARTVRRMGGISSNDARRSRRLAASLGVVFALSVVACSSDDAAQTGPGDGAPGGTSGASGASGSSGAGGTGATGGAGGNAGTGGQGGGGGPATQFWQSFSTSLCHHYLHCYGENYGGADLRAMGGETECAGALVKALPKLHPRVGALNAAVAAGTLSIQESAVQACLDAVASCDYPLMKAPAFEIHFEDVTPCREVFEGTVANGGDCDFSEECAGDAACVHDSSAPSATCAGTCQPRKQAGAACTSDRECGAPSPTAWAVCQQGQCLAVQVNAPGGAGAQCGRVPTNESNPCSDDLWCPAGAFGLNGAAHCSTPLAAGAACDTANPLSSECLQGYCLSGKCTADVVGQKAGASCLNSDEICNSFASLACDGTHCVKADGSAGSPCNQSYWFQKALCPPLALGGNGSPCSSHDACASGICSVAEGCVAKLCSAH